MNANPTLKALRTAAVLAALLGTVNGLAADPVRESFDRMLTHQPGPVTPVTGHDRDADPLPRAMGMSTRPARSSPPADPVAESFARMLAHTPNRTAPPVPADMGTDPLVAAMVEPLRRSLSDSATAQFAVARSAAGRR